MDFIRFVIMNYMSDGSTGPSPAELGLTPNDLGITNTDTSKTGTELKQDLIDKIGFIPVSTPETSRVLRGVFHRDEPDQIAQVGYGFDELGFSGNGVYLPFDQDGALLQIDQSHRGSYIIEFFAFPNMRKEIVQALNGKRPLDGLQEALFAHPRNSNETVRSSGMSPIPEFVLDPEFFEGYFDKSTGEWTPNPSYWENELKAQVKKTGLSNEKYEEMRKLKYEEIKAEARQKLDAWLKQ